MLSRVVDEKSEAVGMVGILVVAIIGTARAKSKTGGALFLGRT